jgi:putative nucleotidyltransferase with HDIG domain
MSSRTPPEAVSDDGLRRSARALAERRLSPLPRRLAHVRGVASAAQRLAEQLPVADADTLVASAWLHDVGYAPTLTRTGFHPLDGAIFLRSLAFPEVVVALVAHHSNSIFEARERGLGAALAALPRPPDDLLDALTYADLVTSPDGEPIEARDRLADMLERYPNDDPVHRAVRSATQSLLQTVARVSSRLAHARPPPVN